MKKLLTAVLACTLAVSMVPVGVSAKKTVYLTTKSTYYTMNEAGKLEKSSETTYTYNKKGVSKKFESVTYTNGKKSGSNIVNYKIKKNRIVSSTAKDTSDGQVYRYKTQYKYKKGKITRYFNYRYDTDKKKYVLDGTTVIKSTSKKSVYKYYSAGRLMSKTVEALNKKGYPTVVKYYDGNEKLTSSNTYKYNKKGYMTKDVYKSSDGEKTVFTYKYTYDKHGNAKVQKAYRNGKLISKSVSKYKKFVF